MPAVVAGCGGTAAERPADLVLRNGKIVTVDPARPEAEALAVRGDTIVAVGTNEEIASHVGPATETIDLAGQLAVPGFIDAHGHFTGLGQSLRMLKLADARSWDEIVSLVADAVKKARPGEWIVGRGWHQEKWDRPPAPVVEGFPTHDALSRVSPDNPVLLRHASGHATFANAKAMALAGVTRSTASPPGGEILMDARGNPTGVLRENASELVVRVLDEARARRTPGEVEAESRRELDAAQLEVLSKGVTTFHDAGSPFETVDLMKRYADAGKLAVRLWVMIREPNDRLSARLAEYKLVDYANGHLTVRAIKLTLDGALGSRGAWLLEPYADAPDGTGLNTVPVDVARETARIAAQNGLQFCVHAIGDRANREALNIFERTFREFPDRKDWRWRIEHAQHLDPADIPRFGRLGVIASMQGIHCTSDAPFVLARLGATRAAQGAYVWRKLLDSGAVVANGTDTPVEDVDPIANFYASVTRRLKDGSVFYGGERMTRAEALRSYTIGAAFAGFEEGSKGSLTPGKLADIVVLSKDIMTIPDDEIPTARVVRTIVGGKTRYQAAVSRSE